MIGGEIIMNIAGAEKEKIKTPSLRERIKRGEINFEEAKREQKKNYGVAIKHIEVPGNPEEEEWVVEVGDRTLSFKGADAMGKMKEWAKQTDGVVVVFEKKTGKLKEILAGELVDDIFLRKMAEDNARADFGD